METKYYRNKVTITSLDQGVEIEPGFLWKREGEMMILVDDDQYVTTQYDVTKFNLEKHNNGRFETI